MLSLTDEWDYTTRGLAAICKEGVDAIGAALKELEISTATLSAARFRDSCGQHHRHRVHHLRISASALAGYGFTRYGKPVSGYPVYGRAIYGKARAIK